MIDCKKTPWLLPAAFTFLLVSPAPARDAEKPLVTPPAPFHDPKGAAQPDATLALRESSAQSAPAGRADANGAKPALDVQATESEIAARVFDRVLVDEPGDGRVWARGRDWKASFGAEGATLIPFLGSDAPKNLPLALALDSARVGGVELALRAPSVAAEEETSVALDHGAVLERWILAKESVEQTFVVSALPARGELVLHVATAGELAASALGDGLAFTSDRGGLQCSGAVAIDAEGRRVKAAVELDEHGYALRVPAEFVTGAVLPITVDPVFSTVSAISNWAYLFEPDYAYDASTNRYCLVYQFNYSQSDGDVVSMLVDASNTVLYNQTQEIDLTADNWSKPRVANNNLADNFFVVAMRFPAGGGNGDIAGRTRSAWTNSAGLQNAISGAESGPKLSPDVGGDPALLAPTYYLVTYERSFSGTDHDVFARLVDSNGAPVGGVITIDNTGGTYDWEPRVSKSDGNPPFVEQEWTIVWARDTGGFGGDTDVYGATVRWDGTITNPTFAVSTGLPDDENPDVSSLTDVPAGARTKLVVFPRFIQTEYDIVGVCLQDTSVVGYIDLSLLESMVHGTWTGEDQQWARVETDGVNFCVLYNESYQHSTFDYDLYALTATMSGGSLQVVEAHRLVDFSAAATMQFQLCSETVSGGFSNRIGMTWQRQNVTPTWEMWTGLYALPDAPQAEAFCFGDLLDATISTICPCNNFGARGNGCANSVNPDGARLLLFGATATDDAALAASGMPATSTCIYLQGDALDDTTFGDGIRCAGGTLVRLRTRANVGGSSSFPDTTDTITLSQRGGVTPGSGARRYYQTYYRNAAAAFCPPGTVNITNGIVLDW